MSLRGPAVKEWQWRRGLSQGHPSLTENAWTPRKELSGRMAQHRLGRSDEARKLLDRLCHLLQQVRWKNDPDAQAFLGGAESLINRGGDHRFGVPRPAAASADRVWSLPGTTHPFRAPQAFLRGSTFTVAYLWDW